MQDVRPRCMVCGKPVEGDKAICRSCQESIRGEAVGKRKKIDAEAEKQMKKHGQSPPRKS